MSPTIAENRCPEEQGEHCRWFADVVEGTGDDTVERGGRPRSGSVRELHDEWWCDEEDEHREGAVSTSVALNSLVRLPQRFNATFPGDPKTIIEIEMVKSRPIVRKLTVSSDSVDLAERDARLPLRSKLVPAAVRAACKTTLYGGFTIEQLCSLPVEETLADFIHGSGVLLDKVPGAAPMYDDAARSARRRRPGRPRHVTSLEELRQIAAIYSERNSISDVTNGHPISRATAYRRVAEARETGLLNEADRERPRDDAPNDCSE